MNCEIKILINWAARPKIYTLMQTIPTHTLCRRTWACCRACRWDWGGSAAPAAEPLDPPLERRTAAAPGRSWAEPSACWWSGNLPSPERLRMVYMYMRKIHVGNSGVVLHLVFIACKSHNQWAHSVHTVWWGHWPSSNEMLDCVYMNLGLPPVSPTWIDGCLLLWAHFFGPPRKFPCCANTFLRSWETNVKPCRYKWNMRIEEFGDQKSSAKTHRVCGKGSTAIESGKCLMTDWTFHC